MIAKGFIYINSKGKIRVSVNPGPVESNEIRFALNIDVPNHLFSRLDPIIHIDLSENAVINVPPEIVAEIVADDISKLLKVDANDIVDGLYEALLKKREYEVVE